MKTIFLYILCCIIFCTTAVAGTFAELYPPSTPQGYLAYLLINEVPFPGEKSYISVDNSKMGMVQVLWVLHCRLRYIPTGYTQKQIANVTTENVINIITAQGQCEGFFADDNGNPSYDPRVQRRIEYLLKIANSGNGPGKFAELLNYARNISSSYIDQYSIREPDIFEDIAIINRIKVTGRAYSWMTNADYYHPGGSFITIPESQNGIIGGNRFYTLKRKGMELGTVQK